MSLGIFLGSAIGPTIDLLALIRRLWSVGIQWASDALERRAHRVPGPLVPAPRPRALASYE